MKALTNLTHEELLFMFRMMQKYGGLTSADEHKEHPPKYNKNKKQYNKPNKDRKNHDNCSIDKPCLYDLGCPSWNGCKDDMFLQFKLIMEKCEQ